MTQENTSSTHSSIICYPLLVTLLPDIGAHRYWKLMTLFSNAKAFLAATPEQLHPIPFISQKALGLITDFQIRQLSSDLQQMAEGIFTHLEQHDSRVITVEDDVYPALLREIHCPPPVLFIKGEVNNLSLPQLAIVGSRHASHQGIKNTQMLGRHLASNGFVITSGMALGIDAAAHQAVLSLQQTSASSPAKTIAVMATGIDDIYPKRHSSIAQQIVEQGGTLVTEFAPGTPPRSDHFPRRNRIISGLSLGVIVVEANIKSGSLITAHYAVDQGREVFAIPGSIHNPLSKGCHQLIKNGATLIENSQDIIDQLDGMMGHTKEQVYNALESDFSALDQTRLSKDEQSILDAIGFEIVCAEDLLATTHLLPSDLSGYLIDLEINGWIKLSDKGYERV